MKRKSYIQPRMETMPIVAMYNLLGASKPFSGGGGATDPSQQPIY